MSESILFILEPVRLYSPQATPNSTTPHSTTLLDYGNISSRSVPSFFIPRRPLSDSWPCSVYTTIARIGSTPLERHRLSPSSLFTTLDTSNDFEFRINLVGWSTSLHWIGAVHRVSLSRSGESSSSCRCSFATCADERLSDRYHKYASCSLFAVDISTGVAFCIVGTAPARTLSRQSFSLFRLLSSNLHSRSQSQQSITNDFAHLASVLPLPSLRLHLLRQVQPILVDRVRRDAGRFNSSRFSRPVRRTSMPNSGSHQLNPFEVQTTVMPP